MITAITLDPRDDLAVALCDLRAGASVSVNGAAVTLATAIPAKQKFALKPFRRGDLATMYGVTVGEATEDIPLGGLISTANLTHRSATYSASDRSSFHWQAPDVSDWKTMTFDGFYRPDGSVGTANHWIVIPLVFCENRNLIMMREALERALGYAKATPYERFSRRLADLKRAGATRDQIVAASIADDDHAAAQDRLFPNVDGVKFLLHGLGCGGTKDDARTLCGLLAGYITHPNVAGATVLSLGCQHAQFAILQEEIARRTPKLQKPLLFFEQQKWPSEERLLEAALRETFAGIAEADQCRRSPAPLSKLNFGMECGGSDGFSGISANPAIGHAADLLVALGGTAILSEFPELCGVEQELVNRCTTEASSARFAELMRAYSRAAEAVGSGFDQNPSPGNIRDGLITDAIKSAGAAKKGGTSPVTAVLDYPELSTEPGLNLLCTPGGDVESTTALAGAHANVMFFSTGLGTPTGNPIVPVIKVSTNTDMAERLADLIDFDCGPIIRGEATVAQLGAGLLNLGIAVASGRVLTKAQVLGQDDFLPWKRGVSL
jgi:altronate hydrolase